VRGEDDVLLAICLEDHGSLFGGSHIHLTRMLDCSKLADSLNKRRGFNLEKTKLTLHHNSQKKRWRKSFRK